MANFLPYYAFIIFFLIAFLLTIETSNNWFKEHCNDYGFFIFSLLIGCIAFIWTGCITKDKC